MPGKLSTLVACNAIDFVIFPATQAIQERQLVDIEAYLSRLARIRGLSCTTYSTPLNAYHKVQILKSLPPGEGNP